jgi:hypothetical protein
VQPNTPAASATGPAIDPAFAPGQDRDQDLVELDAVLDDDHEEVEEEDELYRRRRRTARIAAWVLTPLALIAFGLLFAPSKPSPSSAAPAGTPTAEVTGSDPMVERSLSAALDAAEDHHARHGTYVGADTGLPTSAGRDLVFVAFGTGEHCVIAAIVDGVRPAQLADPSGEACTPEALAAVSRELTRAAAAGSSQEVIDADELLERAAGLVPVAAMSNFIDGEPSLLGVSDLGIEGVALVTTDRSDVVTLRTTIGACRQLRVTIDGATTPPGGC